MQAAHSTSAPPDPVLSAADRLFYRHGVQAVGMDALRDEAGVSLRRLYRLYPSKDILLAAYLRRRDECWRSWLRQNVQQRCPQPSGRPLAVFDALAEWFVEDEFRGCALVNASAELGDTAPAVRRQAEHHKRAVGVYLAQLLREAGHTVDPEESAGQLMLLIDGAIVQASIAGNAGPAQRARDMAEHLLSATASLRAGPVGARRRT